MAYPALLHNNQLNLEFKKQIRLNQIQGTLVACIYFDNKLATIYPFPI